MLLQQSQVFGNYLIRTSEIFFRSSLSVGFVNLKPILPGRNQKCFYQVIIADVLIIPQRLVRRFIELTPEEVSDLFLVTQTIGKVVEREYGGTSLTIAIQDGPEAGQSVQHVHVHVIPRKKGDFTNNDDIYDELNSWNKLDNDARQPRTIEEMSNEAEMLRRHFITTSLDE